MGGQDDYLWLQHPLCAASAVQADALIHTVIGGKIVAHLVTVATAFILCSAVGAALCLRRLLQRRPITGPCLQKRKKEKGIDHGQPYFIGYKYTVSCS